jgi:hypothetical protein
LHLADDVLQLVVHLLHGVQQLVLSFHVGQNFHDFLDCGQRVSYLKETAYVAVAPPQAHK